MRRVSPNLRVTTLTLLLLAVPLAANASPFDQGIANVETFFTGTLARAASLIAIILGGIGMAFGEQGAGKKAAYIAFGVGFAMLAAQVLVWFTS